MSNAVIFSSWVPTQFLHRSGLYLSYIKQYFKDCDIYVGVNVGTDLVWVDKVEQTLPEAVIGMVDENMNVDSDVSGYKCALKLLKDSGKTYENVYFVHTKGISRPTDYDWYISCRDYFLQFIEKRNEYDVILQNNPGIGGWAHIARKFEMENSYCLAGICKYIEPKNKQITNTMWLLTHYAIRGEIVQWFLENCKEEFFTTTDDRYFFESCFPLIVDLYGLKRENQVFWN
jgi:hypothetical protein